jgi:Zn-dependent protease
MFTDLPFNTLTSVAVVVLMLAFSVSIHEAMHGFVAHYLGDNTAAEAGRLTINPLKHIDLYMTILLPAALLLVGASPIFVAKPVPFDPRNLRYEEFGVALVGLAGPASNLLMAVLAALVAKLAGVDLSIVGGSIQASVVGLLFYMFISLNVAVGIFNLIPFPPLDGSRLLYAFAPDPLRNLMERLEGMGFLLTLLLLLLLAPFILPVISSISNVIISFLLR